MSSRSEIHRSIRAQASNRSVKFFAMVFLLAAIAVPMAAFLLAPYETTAVLVTSVKLLALVTAALFLSIVAIVSFVILSYLFLLIVSL